eukprot:4569601-Amphidinium_carterae.2
MCEQNTCRPIDVNDVETLKADGNWQLHNVMLCPKIPKVMMSVDRWRSLMCNCFYSAGGFDKPKLVSSILTGSMLCSAKSAQMWH